MNIKQQFKSKAMVQALPESEKQALKDAITQDKALINEIPPLPIKQGRKAPLSLLYRFTMPYLDNLPISGVFYNKEKQEAVATDRVTLAIVPTEITSESVILNKDGKTVEGKFPQYTNITKCAEYLTSNAEMEIAPLLGKLKAVSNVWDVLFPDNKYNPYIAVYKDIQFQGSILQRILQALSDTGNISAIIHYSGSYNPVRFEAGNMEIWIMPMRPVSREHKEWTFLDL
jgi:hypothetical protein